MYMENIKIEITSKNTYVVKADTERFGIQEIMYEAPSRKDCVEYINKEKCIYEAFLPKKPIRIMCTGIMYSLTELYNLYLNWIIT